MVTIAQTELNEAYYRVLSLYKQGHLNNLVDAVCYTTNGERLVFRYDTTVGVKGAWIVKTPVKVTYTDGDEDPAYNSDDQNLQNF
jgi:hypothetical protein